MNISSPDLQNSPAKRIVTMCGGPAVVARWIGKDRSWVNRWYRPKAVGGRDGDVPSEYQQGILTRARAEGIDLRPEHFFWNPQPKLQREAA